MKNQQVSFKGQETRILHVLSRKGGVCKSTSVLALASMLASDSDPKDRNLGHKRTAKKVLVIDTDSQNSVAKSILGQELYEESLKKGGLIEGIMERDLTDYVVQSPNNENLFVIQSGEDANTVFDRLMSKELINEKDSEKMLSEAISKVKEKLGIQVAIVDFAPELKSLSAQSFAIDCFDKSECIVMIPISSNFDDIYNQTLSTIEKSRKLNKKMVLSAIVPDVHFIQRKTKRVKEDLEFLRENEAMTTKTEISFNKDLIYLLEDGVSEKTAADRKKLKIYYDLINELNLNNYREEV